MRTRILVTAALASIAALVAGGGRVRAGNDAAARAFESTLALDLDRARAELAAADSADANVATEKARLALYEADCDGAAALLARPDLAKTDEGSMLGDIARGCARVIAATALDRDDAAGVEVRWQDEGDRALMPLLVDTIVRAREALTRDLGVTWPRPTRVVVVRDLLALSAMTGLPYEAAKTTGTVAVAKWGRVTLLSPRASEHGYPWRDTVVHELTHLSITRATAERAPLWLQEGVAKREETRWREPGPFDDRPSASALIARGIELKLDLPLDKLGASIAMLPSADQAMVAFAEVTSFVQFFAGTAGDGALPRLLAALRAGKSPDDALRETSGADLKAWDVRWRAALGARKREPLPAVFALGAEPRDLRDLRERARLAELLYGRGHAPASLKELERIKTKDALEDASHRYMRGKVLEVVGRAADAHAAVGEPRDVVSAFGPWWALRGHFQRARGDAAAAGASFAEALAHDPLDEECACGAESPTLCDAARARGEPKLGQD